MLAYTDSKRTATAVCSRQPTPGQIDLLAAGATGQAAVQVQGWMHHGHHVPGFGSSCSRTSISRHTGWGWV